MPVETRSQKRKRATEKMGIDTRMPFETRALKGKRATEEMEIDMRRPAANLADLPWELLEEITRHLDVKDVPKLMMVNKRFYSSYAMDQSIVFGKHVARITVVSVCGNKYSMSVSKFRFYFQIFGNPCVLPFVKRVLSCDSLDYSFCDYVNWHCYRAEWAVLRFLGQLKTVNQLLFCVSTKEECLKFLTSFCGSVKKEATLRMCRVEQDEEVEKQLGKFIQKQLSGCEKINFYCGTKDCRVYLEAMVKTQVKFIEARDSKERFDQIVGWIVNQGIPSRNPEAVIILETGFSRIDTFLPQMQGLQRVDDRANHSALVSHANELVRQKRNFTPNWPGWFNKNSLCFRRRIDPTTNCIYVLGQCQFVAFYMPSQ